MAVAGTVQPVHSASTELLELQLKQRLGRMPAARFKPSHRFITVRSQVSSVPLCHCSKHTVPRPAGRRSGVGQRDQPFQHAAGVLELPRRTAQAVGALLALPLAAKSVFASSSDLEECSGAPTDVRTAAQRGFRRQYQYLVAFARRRLSVRGNCLKHTRDPRDAVDVLSEPPAILQPRTGLPWSSGKLYSHTAPQG